MLVAQHDDHDAQVCAEAEDGDKDEKERTPEFVPVGHAGPLGAVVRGRPAARTVRLHGGWLMVDVL